MKPILILLFFFFCLDTAFTKGFVPSSFESKFDYLIPKIRKGQFDKIPVNIDYQKPGNLRYEIKGNKQAVVFVCNKFKTWVYNPPAFKGVPGELKVGDSSKYCFSKVFQALDQGLISNKVYSVNKNKDVYELVFTPKAKAQLGITKIELKFRGKEVFLNLDELKIFKGKNKPVIYIAKSFKADKKFKKEHFKFTPPENTNTSKF